MNWLLLLPQLPASPSTLRVNVWRRLRAAGAYGLQNGVWVLPSTPELRKVAEGMMAYVHEQGALSYAFEAVTLDSAVEAMVLAGLRAERDEEYAEFRERAEALLAEIKKETMARKFTFAELEETESEAHKLESWLNKIIARDFVAGSQKPAALKKLEQCRHACKAFADKVYARQGIDPGASSKEKM